MAGANYCCLAEILAIKSNIMSNMQKMSHHSSNGAKKRGFWAMQAFWRLLAKWAVSGCYCSCWGIRAAQSRPGSSEELRVCSSEILLCIPTPHMTNGYLEPDRPRCKRREPASVFTAVQVWACMLVGECVRRCLFQGQRCHAVGLVFVCFFCQTPAIHYFALSNQNVHAL